MNVRLLKHLGVVAALVGSVLSVPAATAAIVAGSQAQFFGTALIDAAGAIDPIDEGSGSSGPNATILIGTGGNTGSYSGFNRNNPVALPFFPNYTAAMNNVPALGPFGFTLLSLPAVVPGGGEDGAPVISTFFRLDAYNVNPVFGGFFTSQGTGVILDGMGNVLSNAIFSFSSQSFTPNSINSFSATLEATATSVIPVPGSMLIFGSGLLLMTAVMRRKTS